MVYYQIDGRVPLRGEYRVKGAKNAALPIMAAAVCRSGLHCIYDCPKIGDVFKMQEILEELGCKTYWDDGCLAIDSTSISSSTVPKELMAEMRSSVFLMGSLLARCETATIFKPGGCKIGKRPIDIHLEGLRELGFEVTEEEEKVVCKGRCKGGKITLPYPSVGATENLIMAALSGCDDTIIENCAIEPEILDLQGFLRTCGFQVHGAGTDTIFVKGKEHWLSEGGLSRRDTIYFIMEDRIEAATYISAVVGTGGKATFRNIRADLLRAFLKSIERMGAIVKNYEDNLEVVSPRTLKSPGFIVTEPFPGFPTDCQPQILTLSTQCKGLTTIREEIFESRFTHKNELIRMGANIEICGKNAIIKGNTALKGCRVSANDLRGGAALVLAGLMAEDCTIVSGVEHIERGYEDLHKGIKQLGGLIERETT